MKFLLINLITIAITGCATQSEPCACDVKPKNMVVAKPKISPQRIIKPRPIVGPSQTSQKPTLDYYPDVTRDTTFYYVKQKYVYVRSGPFMSSPIVRVIPRGSKIEAVGQEGIWIRLNDYEYISRFGLSANPVPKLSPKNRYRSQFIDKTHVVDSHLLIL